MNILWLGAQLFRHYHLKQLMRASSWTYIVWISAPQCPVLLKVHKVTEEFGPFYHISYYKPLSPFSIFDQNLDSKIRREHQKNFLEISYIYRLWVGRC